MPHAWQEGIRVVAAERDGDFATWLAHPVERRSRRAASVFHSLIAADNGHRRD